MVKWEGVGIKLDDNGPETCRKVTDFLNNLSLPE